LRFNAQISIIDFNLRGFRRALDQEMQENTKDAARSWLRTVLVIIPTWSRASRATFEKLASAVGYNVTYGPLRSRQDRASLGRSESEGGVDFTPTSWHFFYETDLRYLAYNEFNRVVFGQAPNVFSRSGLTNPTPYRFQDAGMADFQSFSSNIILPSPIEFIRGRRI